MLLLASLGHIFLDRFLQKVDYDSPRGGVSVVIEKAKWTTSHLLIQKATSKDSGIYKCVPLNAMTATINLHVLRGEREGEDIYSLLPPLLIAQLCHTATKSNISSSKLISKPILDIVFPDFLHGFCWFH